MDSHSRKEKVYTDLKKKTYIHEDCIINTLKSIGIDDKYRELLNYRVRFKYVRKRLHLAFDYQCVSDFDESYAELKKEKLQTKVDIINYYRIHNKLFDLSYRSLRKVRVCIRRFISGVKIKKKRG